MYQALCGGESRACILRIAIIQSTVYALIVCLSIFGAIYYSEDFDSDDEGVLSDNDFFLADRLYIVTGILNSVPFLLAVMLFIGVFTEKYELVRVYIFLKIFETIINTIMLLVICILISYSIHSYYAIFVCATPVIIAIWMLESIVNVNLFYTQKIAGKNNTQPDTRRKNTQAPSNVA
ncbi:hypothetical protein QE152_g13854 [Popillia japonica]|uniref:Uncharacterized protein n=1 Tax=Popillia japonica TaxID=7064 RepID=A0AAW1LBF0_POPJA